MNAMVIFIMAFVVYGQRNRKNNGQYPFILSDIKKSRTFVKNCLS
jgi:hypothetical protein